MHVFAAVSHRKKWYKRQIMQFIIFNKSFSCSSVLKDSVVGIMGDIKISAASKTASDSKEIFGGQSRK